MTQTSKDTHILDRMTDSMRLLLKEVPVIGDYINDPPIRGNPYRKFYKKNQFLILGRPFRYNFLCDPNHRVYQKTILKNAPIITLLPGKPVYNADKMSRASDIIERHRGDLNSGSDETKNKAAQKVMSELIAAKCDLRYASFEEDVTTFYEAFNRMSMVVGNSIFGSNFSLENLRNYFNIMGGQSSMSKGFAFYAESATSVSEDNSNNFQASVFEQFQKTASNLSRQLQFIGQGVSNIGNIDETIGTTNSNNANGGVDNATATSELTSILSSSVAGSTFQFPQVYDSSEYSKSYNISFKFMSPCGDDRSIYWNVLYPFLFLWTLSTPMQEGVSGTTSPFLVQVDMPGYFSTPMGVVTSFSFTKGGDERLFNARGLPLCIEGTITIKDLYSQLSVPVEQAQLGTNLGTLAFLYNLGGLSFYAATDPGLLTQFGELIGRGVSALQQPLVILDAAISKAEYLFGWKDIDDNNPPIINWNKLFG